MNADLRRSLRLIGKYVLKGIFSARGVDTFVHKIATMKKSTLLFLFVFAFGFFSIAQQVYPCYKNGLWGFVDEKKNFLVQPQYSDAREFVYGLAAVQKNKKWGAVNTKGKIIIPIQYDRVFANDFGYYEVTTGLVEMNAMSGKRGIYDTTGKLILPIEYSYLSSGDFEEGAKLVHFMKTVNMVLWIVSARSSSLPFMIWFQVLRTVWLRFKKMARRALSTKKEQWCSR
jgi:hypothetical protein